MPTHAHARTATGGSSIFSITCQQSRISAYFTNTRTPRRYTLTQTTTQINSVNMPRDTDLLSCKVYTATAVAVRFLQSNWLPSLTENVSHALWSHPQPACLGSAVQMLLMHGAQQQVFWVTQAVNAAAVWQDSTASRQPVVY